MQFVQLRYLVEVDKTGSISAAAQNLHVSQSTISKSISLLERNLGLKLFHRLRTGLEPTEIGQQMISKAKSILHLVEELHELASEYSGAGSNKLRIACVPMFTQMLSEPIDVLLDKYSNVQLSIIEKNSKEALLDVKNQEADVGIMVVSMQVALVNSKQKPLSRVAKDLLQVLRDHIPKPAF